MEISNEQRFYFPSLIFLLSISPLFYGGHLDCVALSIGAGLLLLLILRLLSGVFHGRLSFLFSPADVFIFLFFVWSAIGLKRPMAPPDAFLAYLQILTAAGFFFISRKMAFDEISPVSFILVLSTIAAGIVLCGVFQLLDVLPHGWWRPHSYLAATFVNHNHFAAYLEIVAPLSLAVWFSAPMKPQERFLSAVSTVLITMGIVLSCSRGAWLSLTAASAIVLSSFHLRRPDLKITARGLLFGLFGVGMGCFLLTRQPVFRRALSLLEVGHDPSAQMRLGMWAGSWDFVRTHGLLGSGMQSFLYAFPLFRPAGLYRLIDYGHNEYLQTAAEFGLPGLLLVLCFYFLIFRRVLRLARFSQTPWKRSMGIAGLISLMAFALHSFVDFPWHIPAVGFEWAAVAGLVSGISFQADSAPLRVIKLEFQTFRRFAAGAFLCLILAGTGVLIPPFFSLLKADFLAYRGRMEKSWKKSDSPAPFYRKAAALAPYRPRYFQQLGDSLQKSARRDLRERPVLLKEAGEAYRKVLKLIPYDSRSMNGLGLVEKSRGHFKEAGEWLSKSLEQDPRNPLYWKDWAELKHAAGDAKSAAQGFRHASDLSEPFGFFPSVFGSLKDPETFIAIGQSARSSGHTDFAQTSFEIAKEFSPGSEEAAAGLAAIFLDRKNEKKALEIAAEILEPRNKARWFSELARYYFENGDREKAAAALAASLQFDSSNLLAYHIKFLLASAKAYDGLSARKVLVQILALNHSPVMAGEEQIAANSAVWEPEMGNYPKGKKVYQGWGLFGRSALAQPVFLPPGKVLFRISAKGTPAKGKGPQMKVTWNGRTILDEEVSNKSAWQEYSAEAEVRPGESLLKIGFTNDFKDVIHRQDRNLKVDKVTAVWKEA